MPDITNRAPEAGTNSTLHSSLSTLSFRGRGTAPRWMRCEKEMENLQYAAGIMFWALVDFVLGGIWLAVIAGVIQRIVKGRKHD